MSDEHDAPIVTGDDPALVAEVAEALIESGDEPEPTPPWGSAENPIILKLSCQRCGMPMPDVVLNGSEESKVQLRAINSGAATTHDICPLERAAREQMQANLAASKRRFEVHCSIREVKVDGDDPGQAEHRDEIAGLTAEVLAVSLPEAMRPLAAALGEKWLEIEKHAALIDVPVLDQ